jgi:hypothetical protein
MLFSLLIGCLPFGLGADETDGYTDQGPILEDDPGPDEASVEPVIVDFDDRQDGVDPGLTLTPGPGSISVSHVLTMRCGTVWAGASVASGDRVLEVAYDASVADTASVDCLFTLTYRIAPVDLGAWTVQAAGDSATVRVSE